MRPGMRKMQLGMRREVIKNAENAIENAPGTAPESQKAYKKLISQKFSLFSPFTLDITLDYSIFVPVNERRQQKQNADVAQLDRAFGYEPKGSRFESWHPQKRRPTERLVFFFFIFVVLKPVGLKDPVTFCVSVILSVAKNPVISRITTQDFTGCFEAMPLNMTLNASASEWRNGHSPLNDAIKKSPLASPTCFCVFSSLWNKKATHTFSSAKETAPCT